MTQRCDAGRHTNSCKTGAGIHRKYHCFQHMPIVALNLRINPRTVAQFEETRFLASFRSGERVFEFFRKL
jgi:hypothetical protein